MARYRFCRVFNGVRFVADKSTIARRPKAQPGALRLLTLNQGYARSCPSAQMVSPRCQAAGNVPGNAGRRKLGSDWRGVAHALVDMGGELLEIGNEFAHQIVRGAIVILGIGPGRARIEQPGIDAVHRDRNLESEVWILAEGGIVEAAVERGVEQRPGCLDRHAADPRRSRRAAGPAGADQPALYSAPS